MACNLVPQLYDFARSRRHDGRCHFDHAGGRLTMVGGIAVIMVEIIVLMVGGISNGDVGSPL